jgi:DNA-directed RNA polymerase specialized sigma24 family protein
MTLSTSERWALSSASLDRLLGVLAATPETGAQEYERLRGKLVAFFERRGAALPDRCADETFDRVARRAEGGLVIERPRAYVFAVARHVLQESARRTARELRAQADWTALHARPDTAGVVETRIECVRRCLQRLPAESRETIQAYYAGDGAHQGARRAALAARLGIEYGTLKTRVCRIRRQLAQRVSRCLAREDGDHSCLPAGGYFAPAAGKNGNNRRTSASVGREPYSEISNASAYWSDSAAAP